MNTNLDWIASKVLLRFFVFLFFSATIIGCGMPDSARTSSATPNSTSVLCPALTPAEGGTSPNYLMHGSQPLYLRGFNIAWFNFADDFSGGLDEARLRAVLADVKDVGGNSLRWWLHVDGSSTPEWSAVDKQRMVVGPGHNLIENFNRALDLAAEYQVYLVPSLWSFDMLKGNAYRRPPNRDNYRLLTEDPVLKSYLENALIPMVKALNGHPQLLAWELFNEPENMTEPWLAKRDDFYGGPIPTLAQLQRVHGLMAAAIHETALGMGQIALVTTGSKSLGKYNSDVSGGSNLYRDDRLIAAADGNCLATLDFYAPHYYNNENRHGAWSPFHHPASHWGLNKPIVIGEFYADRPLDVLNDPVEANRLCRRLVDNGYAGGWSWQWNEHRDALMACEKNVGAGREAIGPAVHATGSEAEQSSNVQHTPQPTDHHRNNTLENENR